MPVPVQSGGISLLNRPLMHRECDSAYERRGPETLVLPALSLGTLAVLSNCGPSRLRTASTAERRLRSDYRVFEFPGGVRRRRMRGGRDPTYTMRATEMVALENHESVTRRAYPSRFRNARRPATPMPNRSIVEPESGTFGTPLGVPVAKI